MSDAPYLISVSLYVRGENLDPNRISEIIGLTPTSSGRRGGSRTTDSGRQVHPRSGFWVFSTKRTANSESELDSTLNTDLENLARSLPNHEVDLSVMVSPNEIFLDIYIGVDLVDRSARASFVIKPSIMMKLSSLGIPIDITIDVDRR